MPDDLNDFPRRGMPRDRDHQRLDDLLRKRAQRR